MPRKGAVAKRSVLPDPVYNSKLITKLVNVIMHGGKRSTAQSIVYCALDKVKDKIGREPLGVFEKAMENVSPSLEVKARRVGGATYQVPIEVRADRRRALGLRWIVKYARDRSERTMIDRLAGEISDAFGGSGAAVKKRDDTHKMAEANKAFAHYRWWYEPTDGYLRIITNIVQRLWRDIIGVCVKLAAEANKAFAHYRRWWAVVDLPGARALPLL